MTETDRFYLSPKWQKKRKRILRRDGYIDQIERRYSATPKEADVVHHIFPRELYPEYEWCDWNLISTSTRRHNTLHDRNTNQLTAEGIKLLERTARKYEIKNDYHERLAKWLA